MNTDGERLYCSLFGSERCCARATRASYSLCGRRWSASSNLDRPNVHHLDQPLRCLFIFILVIIRPKVILRHSHVAQHSSNKPHCEHD